MAINMNKLAQEVTQAEGLRVSLPIAQVKEVLRIVVQKLAERQPSEVLALLERVSAQS